jgi:hypothetical protein
MTRPSNVVDIWYHVGAGASRRSQQRRRSLIRSTLSTYLAVAPDAVTIDVGPHGKPFVVGSDLEFSVAYDEQGTACAVTYGAPVGIDVELPGAVGAVDQLLYVCTGRERRAIEAGFTAQERTRIFLRLWTRKEAVLKACGVGFLETAPDLVDTIDDVVDTGGRRFRVVDIDLPGACCAVARQGLEEPSIRLFLRNHHQSGIFNGQTSWRSTREHGVPQGNGSSIAAERPKAN